MKYEYKAIRLEFHESEQYKGAHREAVGDVVQRINELGKQGWRLVESIVKDGWLEFALMERIVTTASTPQPAHHCEDCAFFDGFCRKWGTYTGGLANCCGKFRPKQKEQ